MLSIRGSRKVSVQTCPTWLQSTQPIWRPSLQTSVKTTGSWKANGWWTSRGSTIPTRSFKGSFRHLSPQILSPAGDNLFNCSDPRLWICVFTARRGCGRTWIWARTPCWDCSLPPSCRGNVWPLWEGSRDVCCGVRPCDVCCSPWSLGAGAAVARCRRRPPTHCAAWQSRSLWTCSQTQRRKHAPLKTRRRFEVRYHRLLL